MSDLIDLSLQMFFSSYFAMLLSCTVQIAHAIVHIFAMLSKVSFLSFELAVCVLFIFDPKHLRQSPLHTTWDLTVEIIKVPLQEPSTYSFRRLELLYFCGCHRLVEKASHIMS